jgi:cytochrome c553
MSERGRGPAQPAGVMFAALAALAFAGTATAQATAPGDAKRGKELSYTCLGCHGIAGYKNAYPDYSVPKLQGQHAEYLVAALHGYRDGDRSHLTMHSEASTLSDQDMADIAVYFAGTPLQAGKAGAVPQAAVLCTACHGADGVSVTPMYPSLAGQHQDYLKRALEEYQKGGRKNPVMKGLVASLKDEDIAVITRFYSALSPGLHTEPRPYTVLGEKP